MSLYYQNNIPEYQQHNHLVKLEILKTVFRHRTNYLGSAIQEVHDRISSGRYNNIDELIELRNAVSIGEKRLQDLKETKKKVEKEYSELVYLLN